MLAGEMTVDPKKAGVKRKSTSFSTLSKQESSSNIKGNIYNNQFTIASKLSP